MNLQTEIRINQFEELEIRNDGSDERLVCGIAAPFDTPALVFSPNAGRVIEERIQKGAFSRTIQQRASKVKVFYNHQDTDRPFGSARVLEERNNGLYVELRISKTQAGDEILELVKDEVLDSFSVGFMPVQGKDVWNERRNSVTRTEVKLLEVSLVHSPAYQDARIEEVRSKIEALQNAPILKTEWHRKLADLGLSI